MKDQLQNHRHTPLLSSPRMSYVSASVRLADGSASPYDKTSKTNRTRNRWLNIVLQLVPLSKTVSQFDAFVWFQLFVASGMICTPV